MSEPQEGFVYLRPDPLDAPFSYIYSIEKAGLAINPDELLGIYTAGTGPAGPKGDPGLPYLNDTIIASASDEYSPLLVDLIAPATTYRAPYGLELEYVRASLTTAPVGGPLIVDIHINGVSLFVGTNFLTIDAGSRTSVGSTAYVPAFTTILDDAEIQIFIRQVGPTVAGTGLKISLTGEKQDAP